MCVVCTSMRPWSRDCAYNAAEDDVRAGTSATAENTLQSLDVKEIGAKLLTDFWNTSTPRSFDVEAGETLTYDVSELDATGRLLARTALGEWSTTTGLRFQEVSGSFRPTSVVREVGDAPASTAMETTIHVGQAFDGRIGRGDTDWVKLDLPESTLALTLESRGGDGLDAPQLDLLRYTGSSLNIPFDHREGKSEAFVSLTGGGTYYARVSGLDGSTGNYRLSVHEPGAQGTADIVFDDELPGAYAHTSLMGDTIVQADVNVGRSWLGEHGREIASYGYQTYLHEIGHALGLGHPGDYSSFARFNSDAEFANDSWQTTVMSYFSQEVNPHVKADRAYAVTPMAADIDAVQRLYGEAEVRGGDTVYGFGSDAGGVLEEVVDADEALAFTILDTGGHDEIDFSGSDADQKVNLGAGRVSDVLGYKGNMTIAPGTRIEDVRLGGGDDKIKGTGRDNVLEGGGGADKIAGKGGDDTLHGDDGRDKLKGGNGDDVLLGGRGDDKIKGGDGADELRGHSGDDKLKGGDGRDVLAGGSGDDVLVGGGHGDVFSFNDGGGRDRIKDFAVRGGDRIDLSAVTMVESWSDLRANHLREVDGDALIRVGASMSIELTGVDRDALGSDDFIF